MNLIGIGDVAFREATRKPQPVNKRFLRTIKIVTSYQGEVIPCGEVELANRRKLYTSEYQARPVISDREKRLNESRARTAKLIEASKQF